MDTQRPESGMIRFIGSGDTGVFLKGDEANFYSRVIEAISTRFRDYPLDLTMTQLESLGRLLKEGEKAPISKHQFVKLVDVGALAEGSKR